MLFRSGAQAALPMWIAYMGKAMKGVEEVPRAVPEGVVQARINPDSGLRETEGKGIPEYFYQEFLPPERDGESAPTGVAPGKPGDDVKGQLF